MDKTDDFEEFKRKYLQAVENDGNMRVSEEDIEKTSIKMSVNLFTKGDSIYYDAFSIEEEPGFEDIKAHGSSTGIQIGSGASAKLLSASEFAKYLTDSTSYSGGDIRLASCQTGKGDNSFAQQLSKILHVKVKAPDDDVYYMPEDGVLFVGSPTHNAGSWRVFENGEEIK